MTDPMPPKRPDDLTPDAGNSRKPQPVHPLMRKPEPPRPPDDQPARPAARVKLAFSRPSRSLVTWGLIGLNLAIFALVEFVPGLKESVVPRFANQPLEVLQNAEYWRLFTAMFLHADIPHVLINMLALFSLGGIIEITFGHTRYILVYLLGGLTGSILSAALNQPEIYAVGASGAVFAVFGAEAAHLYNNWRVMGPSAPLRLRQVVMLAVLNFAVGFIGSATGGGLYNIDNWAHIGGFIGGAMLAHLIGPRYAVRVSPDQTQIEVSDTRPLRGQAATVIYFAAGLLAALIVAVIT